MMASVQLWLPVVELAIAHHEVLAGKKMRENRACVLCNDVINPRRLSFEQLLIDDTDFCRTCWDEIMQGEYPGDVPILALAGEAM